MRIISEYHDFYDGVMALDQDRQLVYERKIVEVDSRPIMVNYPSAPAGYRDWKSKYEFYTYPRIIGFCGKVYPVLQLGGQGIKEIAFAYDVTAVDDFVKKNYGEIMIESYFSKKWDKKWARPNRHDMFEKFFDEARAKQGAYEAVFTDYKVPIWVYDYSKNEKRLILNAPLKQLEFFRVMDAYTAYQELLMYYGGMAQPLKPIPVMDDQTMAESQGHGGKYSFRKPPQSG